MEDVKFVINGNLWRMESVRSVNFKMPILQVKEVIKLKMKCQCGDPAEGFLFGTPYCDECFRSYKPKGRRKGAKQKFI